MDSDEWSPDDGDTESSEIPGEEKVIAEIEGISLAPSEHQQVKDLVNGEQMNRIKGYDRRYLIVGAGGETGAATRRRIVMICSTHGRTHQRSPCDWKTSDSHPKR
jgi:hypothetical protein